MKLIASASMEERRRSERRRPGRPEVSPASVDDLVEGDAGDQREGGEGEDVVEEVVRSRRASAASRRGSSATPISGGRRAAEEDHRQDHRQEAAGDLQLRRRRDRRQVAEDREGEQDRRTGRGPSRRVPARARTATATTAISADRPERRRLDCWDDCYSWADGRGYGAGFSRREAPRAYGFRGRGAIPCDRGRPGLGTARHMGFESYPAMRLLTSERSQMTGSRARRSKASARGSAGRSLTEPRTDEGRPRVGRPSKAWVRAAAPASDF